MLVTLRGIYPETLPIAHYVTLNVNLTISSSAIELVKQNYIFQEININLLIFFLKVV